MHSLDSGSESKIDQCFKVIFLKETSKIKLLSPFFVSLSETELSREVYLAYDNEKERLSQSIEPYLFNIELLNNQELEALTESTKFMIRVKEDEYLCCHDHWNSFNKDVQPLTVQKYDKNNHSQFVFHFLKQSNTNSVEDSLFDTLDEDLRKLPAISTYAKSGRLNARITKVLSTIISSMKSDIENCSIKSYSFANSMKVKNMLINYGLVFEGCLNRRAWENLNKTKNYGLIMMSIRSTFSSLEA